MCTGVRARTFSMDMYRFLYSKRMVVKRQLNRHYGKQYFFSIIVDQTNYSIGIIIRFNIIIL